MVFSSPRPLTGCGIAALAISCLLLGCSGGSQEGDPDAALHRPAALSAAMRNDFGAATKVSPEVAGFWSLHHGGALWRDLWQSTAVQRLVQSPGVVMALETMRHRDPQVEELLAMVDSPMGQRIMAALGQVCAQELFLALDGEAPRQLQALGALYRAVMWSMIRHQAGGGWGPPPFPLAAMLELREDLAVPELLFGARLSDPEASPGPAIWPGAGSSASIRPHGQYAGGWRRERQASSWPSPAA